MSNFIPAPDILKFFSVLTEAYKESQTTKLELANLESQKEIVLKQIWINLIEIDDEDIQNLDDVLPRKLLKFGIQAY